MCFFKKKREEKKALQEKQLKKEQETKKKAVFVGGKKAPIKKKVSKVPLKVEKTKVEEDKKNEKYHISQNKDKKSNHYKQWRVRKEGSSKTIKYFETQVEAIDFAEDLATKNDTSVVIHKLDGSIRKQEY